MKNWWTSVLFVLGVTVIFVGGQGSMHILQSWMHMSHRVEKKVRTEALNVGKRISSTRTGGPGAENSRPTKSTPMGSSGFLATRQQVQELKLCLETRDCFQFFQQDDGKLGYHYAVSRDVAAAVMDLLPLLEKGELAVDGEVITFVQELLGFPEDHVRDAAFRLVPFLPLSEETLRASLGALDDSVSAPLYQLGLRTLRNYSQDPAYNDLMSQFLAQKLVNGGHLASIEVAKGLFPIINSGNVELFQETLAKLSPASQAHEYLRSGLEEYEVLTAGF
ncbi:MAG: hypothetical protein KDD43_06770 [Bdellovibrionales bacterium]|nr:hypothetical protein [Bdellovibrionales bacterium]